MREDVSGREPLKKESPSDGPHRHSHSRPSPTLKVVLLGDSGVGKTCLRSQFVHHVFSNAYKATIGGDYLTTTVEVEKSNGDRKTNSNHGSRDSDSEASRTGPFFSESVSLQVWDTAGQERYNSISQAFYRGADVAVLVYDSTSYESLLSVRDWFARFLQHCQVDAPGIVIVGNKSDRAAERAVDKNEVRDILCRNSRVPLADHVTDWDQDVFDISCKNLASVEDVFQRVAVVGLAKAETHGRDRCRGVENVVLDDAPAVSSRCAC